MTIKTLTPQFVAQFPEQFEAGMLYLAMEFSTAAHLCACGCGRKVITPFSPTDWQMEFDGETVSLKPSIGNWAFPCRSHYWLFKGRIEWSGNMSDDAIKRLRLRDVQIKAKYEESRDKPLHVSTPQFDSNEQVNQKVGKENRQSLIRRFMEWLKMH